MRKKSIMAGILFVVLGIAVLYAQTQTPKAEPILTEKAVKGFIKNHSKLLKGINAFYERNNSKETQWVESFQAIVEEDFNQVAAFLKKNPAPKKLQAVFKKYGLDGKTGVLQIMVITYTALSSEHGDMEAPFAIHPDDIKLVQKYRTEVSELLKPIPVETETDSGSKKNTDTGDQ